MRSLDLFSGIGGITHALRGLGVSTTMYCEILPNAQDILRARIRAGQLPDAPIHTDVRTLRDMDETIDIILAGSPCTGFSVAGKRAGLENAQSGLFDEVMRLAGVLKPTYLFFENVAAIRTTGLTEVTTRIHAAGYTARWITMPGHVVGAPQHRRRWYCLCVSMMSEEKKEVWNDATWRPHPWTQEPTDVPRMIPRPKSARRLHVLGNSVIPDAVRAAFLMCWTGFRERMCDVMDPARVSWRLQDPVPSTTTSGPAGMVGRDGIVCGATCPALPPPSYPGIVLVPTAYVPPEDTKKNPRQTADRIQTPMRVRAWATPRATGGNVSGVLTSRSNRDLGTQLRFEKDTPDDLRDGRANPEWVEWLMGFPTGWTEENLTTSTVCHS